jgi:Holliday junction resolvase-like predicted endonuclease
MAQNKHISIGRIGEDIVAGYLERRGFSVVCRNYRKKWGELDIIAKKAGVVHFIEVKTGSWNKTSWPSEGDAVYRPEDHMHVEKRARMTRAIRSFLEEHSLRADEDWTADLVVVLINTETRKARVRVLWDILLDE